jgi:ATP-dependent DNA ligase
LRDGIQVSEAITGDGAAIFRHACWMDLEGIVSKRIGSRYMSGRTRAWLRPRTLVFSAADAMIHSSLEAFRFLDGQAAATFGL